MAWDIFYDRRRGIVIIGKESISKEILG